MQLLVRCGVPVGTLAVECEPDADAVGDVKERICGRSACLGPASQLRLQHGPYALDDERLLSDVPGLGPGSTLQLCARLRGGGGDGGCTGAESRSCYLEMYLGKKADKVNPREELLANWTRCHLSGEPLTPPCVVDDLGYVYNKEVIIHHLLNKTMPTALVHITGLKSLTELKLHRQEGGQQKSAASQVTFQPGNDTDFSCPIAGVPFNGRFKFVAIRPSGLVVSEKALKEVPAAVQELVGEKWADDDLVPINPTGEVLEAQQAKAAAKLAAERDKRKAKKAAKADADGAQAAGTRPGAGDAQLRKRSASPPPVAGAEAAAAAVHNAKRSKGAKAAAVGHMPAGSTKEVFASLFTSSSKMQGLESAAETFCCRALGARGLNLT